MGRNSVCIVIINFGTPEHTIECLQSIRENNYQDFNVVIVDIQNINYSIEKIATWKDEKQDSRFVLIREYENKGFAYANNIGIAYSLQHIDCDFLWILNNDTVIHQAALQRLFSYYNQNAQNQNIGFIGSKILDYNNRDIIQNVGGTFNTLTNFPDWIGMGEVDKGQFDDKGINIDHILGASMFFHKSLVQQIGLMPEIYFLYFEDTDWCISAQKAGYKNLTCPGSIVYHKQGITTEVKYLNNDKHLQNKKYFYTSFLKFYNRQFKKHLPIAYIILFKYIVGKACHGNFAEARLILQVIFQDKGNEIDKN